jgi:hypothetical protein
MAHVRRTCIFWYKNFKIAPYMRVNSPKYLEVVSATLISPLGVAEPLLWAWGCQATPILLRFKYAICMLRDNMDFFSRFQTVIFFKRTPKRQFLQFGLETLVWLAKSRGQTHSKYPISLGFIKVVHLYDIKKYLQLLF